MNEYGMNNAIAEMSNVYHLENWIDDKVYHNAKALLKIYTKVVWRIGQGVSEIEEEAYEFGNSKLLDYVNCLVDIDTRINRERFEQKLQCLAESSCIVKLINKALIKLKSYPRDGERYFQIINQCYLAHSKHNETYLLERFEMSRATFYRDKKRAVSLLGVILWGFIIPDVIKTFNGTLAYGT